MNNLQKTTINVFDYDFEWNGEMSIEDFLEINENYYSKLWEEENPEKAYKINDGDLEEMYNDIDMVKVREDMEEVYHTYLQSNRNM